jgi:hypothetical protein
MSGNKKKVTPMKPVLKVAPMPQVPTALVAARKKQVENAIKGLGAQIQMLQERKKQLEERLKTL